jgi:flavin-dependent dehydrogenase
VERVDVLVVGGGPAGSSLAFGLRESGLRVRILDRCAFPRDKTCAGWVTPAVWSALALEPKDYAAGGRTLQPIHGFRVGRLGAPAACAVREDGVVSHGILRCEFDAFLLARSEAELRLGEPLRRLERRADGWCVNGTVHARLLVGAGGHFCPVARFLCAGAARETPIAAQEIELPLDGDAGVDPALPELWFCADLAGYGWVFRKGGVLNVGLGRHGGEGLAQQLEAFLEGLRAAGRIPRRWGARARGHAYLSHAISRRPLTGPGVALLGDAAGLAHPKSGEGIRPAVESGLLLARALAGANDPADPARLARYEAALLARLGGRPHPGSPQRALPAWQAALGRRLLGAPWFARHVVVERWFLNRHLPALAAAA